MGKTCLVGDLLSCLEEVYVDESNLANKESRWLLSSFLALQIQALKIKHSSLCNKQKASLRQVLIDVLSFPVWNVQTQLLWFWHWNHILGLMTLSSKCVKIVTLKIRHWFFIIIVNNGSRSNYIFTVSIQMNTLHCLIPSSMVTPKIGPSLFLNWHVD